MGEIWAPTIVFSVFALTIGGVLVLRGPMGKALADWIRGWTHTEQRWIDAKAGVPTAEVEALRAEVDELRQQLADVHERLDFTERVLARPKDGGQLARPGGA